MVNSERSQLAVMTALQPIGVHQPMIPWSSAMSIHRQYGVLFYRTFHITLNRYYKVYSLFESQWTTEVMNTEHALNKLSWPSLLSCSRWMFHDQTEWSYNTSLLFRSSVKQISDFNNRLGRFILLSKNKKLAYFDWTHGNCFSRKQLRYLWPECGSKITDSNSFSVWISSTEGIWILDQLDIQIAKTVCFLIVTGLLWCKKINVQIPDTGHC